jgi:hypothetical protein
MRKKTFVTPLSCCSGFLCFAALSTTLAPLFAQDSTSAATPAQEASTTMPSDAKALMLLAAKTNGLTGPDVQPWHTKASFTVLEEGGNAKDQGTIEEFWVSHNEFKVVYKGAAFTQAYYGTQNGVLRAGEPNPESHLLYEAQQELVYPISISEKMIKDYDLGFEVTEHNLGGTKLLCISETSSFGSPPPRGVIVPYFCLDAEKPIVRIADRIGDQSQFIHNNVLQFKGRYLPRDLKVNVGENSVLIMHLDLVESLTAIKDEDFTAPPASMPAPTLIVLPAKDAPG